MHHISFHLFTGRDPLYLHCYTHNEYDENCNVCFQERYYSSDEFFGKVAIFVALVITVLTNIIALFVGVISVRNYDPITVNRTLLVIFLGIITGIVCLVAVGLFAYWLLSSRPTQQRIRAEADRVKQAKQVRKESQTKPVVDLYNKKD